MPFISTPKSSEVAVMDQAQLHATTSIKDAKKVEKYQLLRWLHVF